MLMFIVLVSSAAEPPFDKRHPVVVLVFIAVVIAVCSLDTENTYAHLGTQVLVLGSRQQLLKMHFRVLSLQIPPNDNFVLVDDLVDVQPPH